MDLAEVKALAKKHKPKLIWTGATAYVYQYEFDRFAEIADSIGAYLVADIAHIAGLVATNNHQNPVPYVHLVTTTTHKTLRGPRGAMIMVTKKGMQKDPELASKVDKAVFPGLQGGPHDQTTAAIAVALNEAAKPLFKRYSSQIVKNAKSLAKQLMSNGFKLVGNTTENHLMLVDLTPIFGPGGGYFAQYALDRAGITLNKNTIPAEPSSPYFPSGIRLGTPALTTRGMKEKEMKRVANWITEVIDEVKSFSLPKQKEERSAYLLKYRLFVNKNATIKKIKQAIKKFNRSFPIFAW